MPARLLIGKEHSAIMDYCFLFQELFLWLQCHVILPHLKFKKIPGKYSKIYNTLDELNDSADHEWLLKPWLCVDQSIKLPVRSCPTET